MYTIAAWAFAIQWPFVINCHVWSMDVSMLDVIDSDREGQIEAHGCAEPLQAHAASILIFGNVLMHSSLL